VPFRQGAIFWLVAGSALTVFVWAFKSILLPFLVGIGIAYLLNPILLRLDKLGLSRSLSTVLLLALFFLIVLALLALLLPPLYQELQQLAENAPAYTDALWDRLQPYVAIVEESVSDTNLNQSLQAAMKNNVSNALGAGTELIGSVMSGGRALIGFASFIVVTPLVAFYMMIEWENIVEWVDDLLPRKNRDRLRTLFSRIDGKIAGFVRGQLLVALTLGILYAVALSLVGLQFGYIIGLAAGALSIIPLFGSAVGLVTSVGVAYLQSSDLLFVLGVACIFLAGQFLEGNFITPKLIGKSVGLHPLWILFSLLAGGAIFGIVGMLLAVPIAVTAGVLANFMLEQYKDSEYYA